MHQLTKIAAYALFVLFAVACAGTSFNKSTSTMGAAHKSTVAEYQRTFNKALVLMKKQQYRRALPLLESLNLEDSALSGVSINLSIIYMKMAGETNEVYIEKAEAALQRALEINPANSVAHFQMALLLRKTGRFSQSRNAYERALTIDQDYAIAHYNLGVLCDIYLQDAECAIEHYRYYMALVPEDSEKIRIWLSDLHRRQKNTPIKLKVGSS